jgi:uncharacterized PurR-regulated membrane protein YhhQ (DUF165 family)
MAAESGSFRTRTAADASWPSQAFYGRRETFWTRLGGGVKAAGRLFFPVVLLLLSFAAIYLYLDIPATPVVGATDGHWLTVGHLLVPLSFLCVHLTNRRYGPSYAFAQVVLALALGAAFALYAVPRLAGVVPFEIIPDMRVALAFAGAFLGASFISIVVFDGARGPRWWMAPLLGMLVSVVVFGLVFYPAAYAGLLDWTHRMTVHLEFLAGLAVLSLVPYWLLRGLVRPLPGYNGY